MNISVVIISLEKVDISRWKFPSEVTEVIIRHDYGRSKARNEGAKRAKGNFLLFLDDDVDLLPEVWSKYILKLFTAEPNAIVCKEHPVLGTRVCGLSRTLFFQLGGFDEAMETGEDADLGFRALRQNVKIHRIPHDLVTHHTHSRNRLRAVLNRARNQARFILRYHQCLPSQGENEPVRLTPYTLVRTNIRSKLSSTLIILVTLFVSLVYYSILDNPRYLTSELY